MINSDRVLPRVVPWILDTMRLRTAYTNACVSTTKDTYLVTCHVVLDSKIRLYLDLRYEEYWEIMICQLLNINI